MMKIGLWITLIAACLRVSPLHAAPPEPSGVEAPSPTAAPRNMLVADYIAAGVPDPGRRWTAADMEGAAKALARIAETNRNDLPRFESEESGAVLKRLTSPDNLGPFRDPSRPIGERFGPAARFVVAAQSAFKTYALAGFLPSDERSGDLVEVVGMSLRNQALLSELSSEMAPKLDRSDPDYEDRAAVRKRNQASSSVVAISTLAMLRDRSTFRAKDLKRLVSYMDESLPKLLVRWPNDARAEIIRLVESSSADSALDDLQSELVDLAKDLRAADKLYPYVDPF